MAILPLITLPSSFLRQKSLPISKVDNEVRKLMDDMLDTMYHDRGVGLAAVQVGVVKKIIVIDLQEDDEIERPENFYPLCMANPVMLEKSEELITAFEGCLSVPEQKIEVARPANIKVKYLDFNNDEKVLTAEGWLARVIHHEMDHLEGKLLVDYLPSLKKDIVLRKLKKLKKNSV